MIDICKTIALVRHYTCVSSPKSTDRFEIGDRKLRVSIPPPKMSILLGILHLTIRPW